MSLDLYTIGYPEPLPAAQFGQLLALLPGSLQQKVGGFRRWQDAHASLLGKLLLRSALLNAGYPADLNRLGYSETQKPTLPGAPHFNISHSGHRVVCLLYDKGPVGIDIEAFNPFSFEELGGHFTTGEWEAIRNAPSPLAAFYRFWTAKESIIKADGRGLGISLQELDLSAGSPVVQDGRRWSVHELPFFEGYACHYAIETPQDSAIASNLHIHELTINQLYI